MRGVIEQAKHSKSGKSLGVLIQGTWYTTRHFILETKVGQEIVFDPKEIAMGDGAKIQTIQAYTLANELVLQDTRDKVPTPTSAPRPSPVQASPPPNPYQPLVSNLAAHLIAAGLPPKDLLPWYKACVELLEGPRGKPPEDSDDDIPY